jgi:hypothetical protein
MRSLLRFKSLDIHAGFYLVGYVHAFLNVLIMMQWILLFSWFRHINCFTASPNHMQNEPQRPVSMPIFVYQEFSGEIK